MEFGDIGMAGPMDSGGGVGGARAKGLDVMNDAGHMAYDDRLGDGDKVRTLAHRWGSWGGGGPEGRWTAGCLVSAVGQEHLRQLRLGSGVPFPSELVLCLEERESR
jgi:hypothetical protein